MINMKKIELNKMKQILERFNRLSSNHKKNVLEKIDRVLREEELSYGREICQKEGQHAYGEWYTKEYEIFEFDESTKKQIIETGVSYIRECTRCGATEYASTLEDTKKKTK